MRSCYRSWMLPDGSLKIWVGWTLLLCSSYPNFVPKKRSNIALIGLFGSAIDTVYSLKICSVTVGENAWQAVRIWILESFGKMLSFHCIKLIKWRNKEWTIDLKATRISFLWKWGYKSSGVKRWLPMCSLWKRGSFLRIWKSPLDHFLSYSIGSCGHVSIFVISQSIARIYT